MNPTVSIIVPVYNAEKYINRCIDSILCQEYTDFELILADDGSTDASGEICDGYAASDNRVRVFHKHNTGVSDTRNFAIKQAKGTYLQFVDSDDWITPDATKLFVRAALESHCDMVIADFYRVVGKRVSPKGDIDEEGLLNRDTFASHMMTNPAAFYYGVLWNKFFRRELVEKYQLHMDEKLSWCEDFLFNLEYILHAETFYVLQTPVYYYVKTEGSLVSQGMSFSKTFKMKLMIFNYYNHFYKHILDEKEYEKNRLQVYSFLVKAATDGIIPPAILPGSMKLGEEREGFLSVSEARDGILMDAYRERKLLERYLKTLALKYDMTPNEVKLLFYLEQCTAFGSRRELSDFTGISRSSLSLCMQRLSAKNYIKAEDLRTEEEKTRILQFTLLPASEPLLQDFATVYNDYDQVRFQNFTDEELIQYACLTKKMNENIQKVL